MGFDKDYREAPITWERGLIETVEDSMLPPGAAARLRNWIADPSGDIRARVGWLKASTTSAPGTRKGVGIGHLAIQRRPYVVQDAIATQPAGTDPQTVTATWDDPTVAGNLLVARLYVTDNTSSRAQSAHAITAPAGWSLAAAPDATSRRSHCWIYYKANAASQSGTVAFTDTIAAGADQIALALEIAEVANIATSSPLDVTANANNTTSTSPVSGTTADVTVPVGMAVAAFVGQHETDDTYSDPTNDWTLTHEFYVDNSVANDLNAVGALKAYDDGGPQNVSVTYDDGAAGGPNGSCAVIATFKAANYTVTDGYFFVANDENPNIKIYYVDRSNLAAGTWTLLESIAALVDGSPVAFTAGNRKLFYTHVSFTAARSWGGLGTTPAAITGAPAGRCIAWHKSRLFIGGTSAEPWKLHYSEIDDDTVWSGGTAGAEDVGLGDGEAIEDITPFEDGLLIVKQTSAWYLTGSGPDNFRLIRLPAGGGAPGRTVLATPNGAIMAARKHVYLFSGGSVDQISQPISDSYGITGDWMSCSFLNERAYICDEGSGTVWSLDFSTNGTWAEELVGSAATEGPSVLYNQDDKALFAPKNASVGSLLAYRLMPGSSRIKDFDTLSETFEAWTPEMWMVGPQEKMTPRYLFLKLRQRGGDAGDTGLTVTPYYDGTAGTAMTVTPHASAGVYWARQSLGEAKGISSIQLRFSQALPSTEASVFDIDEIVVGFNVESVV